ncbi:MAG: ArsC/Spx/MgsR family protein [Solirubrobacteraceae bacterium]
MTPKLIVYEKRTCSVCRRLCDLLTERGIDFQRIEYLVDGLSEEEIRSLLAKAGMGPRDVLRTREPLVAELSLDDADAVSDDDVVAHMAEHPELLQRPIVVCGERAMLARPVERVLELL